MPEIDELPELPCPGCESDLAWDELFLSHRVCSTCNRHFHVSPEDRIALLTDESGFTPLHHDPDVPAEVHRVAPSRERELVAESVLTGTAEIDGHPTMLVLLNEHAIGAQLGALATEKIVFAFERALARQLPVIVSVAGGTGSALSNPLTLVQPMRISSAISQLHMAGIPTIAVVCQSASAELFGALAGGCDLVIAEPGTRVWSGAAHPNLEPATTQHLLDQGLLDDVISRSTLRTYLSNLLALVSERGTGRGQNAVAATSTPVSRTVQPTAATFAEHLFSDQVVVQGDRAQSRTASVTAGVARLNGQSVCFAAFDRIPETDEQTAVRTLIRVVNLATRWELPLVLLAGDGADETANPAQAMAHARLAGVLAVAPVPVIAAVTGEIRTALGRTLATGDQVLCAAGAGFSVEAAPPGSARPTGWNRINAVEAQRLGLVDVVVRENPERLAETARNLHDAIEFALSSSGSSGYRRRLSDRLQKLRSLGQSTPAGVAALQQELNEFRDLQKNLVRSVEELRDRWEDFRAGKGGISFQRPDLSEFAERLRTRRNELRERAGLSDRD